MMSSTKADFDVLIAGAGAAGLAAARDLTAAGLSVCLVDARDRVGGRIYTIRDEEDSFPIELGAEFVHGKPPQTFSVINASQVALVDVSRKHWWVKNGELAGGMEYFSGLDDVFKRIKKTKADRPLSELLDEYIEETGDNEAKEIAASFIQGFHAADIERAGAHGLALTTCAAESIDEDKSFRVVGGYDQLINQLTGSLRRDRTSIFLEAAIREIHWDKNLVEFVALRRNKEIRLSGRRAVITIPLGVLKKSGSEGGVRFVPAIPEKELAIQKIEMGEVFRIAMLFRERFWEEISMPMNGRNTSFWDLSFLHSRGPRVPTWWTQAPVRVPVLVGWVGGTPAAKLCTMPETEAIDAAIASLSGLIGIPRGKIESLLVRTGFHNWSTDPFSFGAYSYAGVGGVDGMQELAKPVESTLFFAGEATSYDGHWGTVHGAIGTGERAASEILNVVKSAGNTES